MLPVGCLLAAVIWLGRGPVGGLEFDDAIGDFGDQVPELQVIDLVQGSGFFPFPFSCFVVRE